jgi:hypothetical protein
MKDIIKKPGLNLTLDFRTMALEILDYFDMPIFY